MDNILDKFGLYDFFGLLLPGLFFLILLFYINFPFIYYGQCPNSTTFKVIYVILVSYIIGTLIQETTSFFDRKFVKIKEKIKCQFLNSDLFEECELLTIRKMANTLLGKDDSNILFNDLECKQIYIWCKTCLINKNKIEYANKLGAIFAMSRAFILVNFMLFICDIITFLYYRNCDVHRILVLIYTSLSSLIFYMRAKRYAELKIKVIIRQYIDLLKS